MKARIFKPFLLATVLWLGVASTSCAAEVDVARLLAAEPAPTLDSYHLFSDAAARVPSAGLTPYSLNTTLFSDYAEKFRYVFLPPGEKAEFTLNGVLSFPVGTTLIKIFAYPVDFRQPNEKLRYIETRLLIHKSDGWNALTYVWNEAQNEAVLKRAGLRVKLGFVDPSGAPRAIDYEVPNVNQCMQCHSFAGAITPIGPKARNLNGDYSYVGGIENQLAHWTRVGILSGAPDSSLVPRLPRWDDKTAPLARRARAYLDVNCAHCHNRQGLASNSGLYLTYEESDATALGILKRPVAAGRGSGGMQFSIAPGHPEQSILLYRMMSTEPGVMMPQIGRTLSHAEAIELIRDYIAMIASSTTSN